MYSSVHTRWVDEGVEERRGREMESWEMKKETYREGWRNQQPDRKADTYNITKRNFILHFNTVGPLPDIRATISVTCYSFVCSQYGVPLQQLLYVVYTWKMKEIFKAFPTELK